ncbi:MAG: helix-turn-helix domain-containing protein [Candidatus Howiella sp.]|jgi:transcriptional regulator with XRE-family HTH domain
MQSDFPNILSRLRRERGISQKQTAADLGISQALLSHYEKGIRECGLDFLARAAQYFGVTTDYLLGRAGSASTASKAETATPFDAGKQQIINAQGLLFELLRGCEKDSVRETGLDLFRLQTYQTALYILGLCHGDKPFTKPSRYTKPAAEGEIIRCFAKLGLVKEKGDSLSFPLVSPEQLSVEYPELYSDFCSLLVEVEEKL